MMSEWQLCLKITKKATNFYQVYAGPFPSNYSIMVECESAEQGIKEALLSEIKRLEDESKVVSARRAEAGKLLKALNK